MSVLRTYYEPLLDAIFRACGDNFYYADPSLKPQLLVGCRPPQVAVLSASQTLLAQLAAALPPPRWQFYDSQLKAATRARIAISEKRLHDIDAGDVVAFNRDIELTSDPDNLFYCPIHQIDIDPPGVHPYLNLPRPTPEDLANGCPKG